MAQADHQSDAGAAPRVRRFDEQRWLLDNIVRSVGVEWDQPRLLSLLAALGPEAGVDIAGIRQRVGKLSDISPAFEAAASRREAKAEEAAAAQARVTARESFFMAANYWASAQWGLDENSQLNLRYNERKRACYARYAELADHPVEAVWVPFEGRALPAWLHLPAHASKSGIPLVVSIPGMDGFKERGVSLYGDPWLNRGIAVLVVEGPGQYESATLGIFASVPAWIEAGRAIFDWIATRREFDPEKVGVLGRSFGTFFATVATAHEPRFCALALQAPCLEPGCHTLFEQASPTYKRRFMYMSGHACEEDFDTFSATLTWEGHAERMGRPILCVAGEEDELSPHHHTRRMFAAIDAPRRLVVYQGARHTVGGAPSSGLGPSPASVVADWMSARLAGDPFASEIWTVDPSGRVSRQPMSPDTLLLGC